MSPRLYVTVPHKGNTSAGMIREDVHALLTGRLRELGLGELETGIAAPLLGIAEEWIADACREVPGFAAWLDTRAAPWERD